MSKKYRLLMLTTLIISGCSMCYELIISAVSSYLLGNSTLQYSITIGLYMAALGFGSYISKFFKKNLFNIFVTIELCIGIVGGVSSLLLFLSNIYISNYAVVMYLEIIIIGTLAGAEIPIMTRIIEADENDLSVTLSSIFSFDYIGGLFGAIAFPLLLLPKLGYFATSFLCGLLNIVAAMLILWRFGERVREIRIYRLLASCIALFMVLGMIFADNISQSIEDGLYRDHIIYMEQTEYQKIVMTRHRDDVRLYIDGNCQFSTIDEYRYHEALVHIPMSELDNRSEILILGGGDGLAVREVLKYDEVKKIDLVDLDSEMIRICSTNENITSINQDSLKSEKLFVYNEDAYEYLETCNEQYDLIIVDPPAFAKHRGVLKNALRAYQRLNAAAISKVAPGGLVFTYSCSQVVDKEAFALAVFSAAAQVGRSVRILDRLNQPADHSVNIYHPEGEYLKGLLLYVE